jgi:hypothetical protein
MKRKGNAVKFYFKLNQNELIQINRIIFNNQTEYIEFLVKQTRIIKSNEYGTCFAEIKIKGDAFLYAIHWLKDGRCIGDYITPFRASLENIELFNKGCEILAERMEIYLDTNDSSIVPDFPPAFGVLTAVVE